MIGDMAISRREFAQLAGVSVPGVSLPGVSAAGVSLAITSSMKAQRSRLTAEQLVERLKSNLGVPWQNQTLDGFKAGEPSTEVSGVATTAMATMDVLSRAVREKTNVILTL